MEAHYGFEPVFCNIASGWEKSSVENAVAIIRRIAFTPMPHVESMQNYRIILQTGASNMPEHISLKGARIPFGSFFRKNGLT